MDGGQGINSAISSGAAFGGQGGTGPGAVTSLLNFFENLSKAGLKGEEGTQLFSGEFLGGTGSGLGGLKDTGIFSKIFDSILAGADANEAFSAFTGESETSGSNDGGGGSENAFPSTMGAAQGAIDAGMAYEGDATAGGNYSPSPTPGIGAEQDLGIG